MSQSVREPVSRDLLKAELTERTFVRSIRGIDVHVTDAHRSPQVMQEIGRIREVEFREDGGGTGKTVDIDGYDTGSPPFKQLVAWDPENEEIIGMYRYIEAASVRDESGSFRLPTARLFEFSRQFRESILPHTVELGRSVVNRNAKRAVMGLFAAWSGLGAIIGTHPDYRYLFGKFTMYPEYNARARSLIQDFLKRYCPDPDGLLHPPEGLSVGLAPDYESPYLGDSYKSDYNRMVESVSRSGESIPPLVISYLGLSDTMRCFGTARNDHFGGVFESAILIKVADIKEKQWKRYISSFDGQITWE
jgi:hypothetical protein